MIFAHFQLHMVSKDSQILLICTQNSAAVAKVTAIVIKPVTYALFGNAATQDGGQYTGPGLLAPNLTKTSFIDLIMPL